jgi:dolichol kinase
MCIIGFMLTGPPEIKGKHINYARKFWHLAGGGVVILFLEYYHPSKLPAVYVLLFAVVSLAVIDLLRYTTSWGNRMFWEYLGFLTSEKEKRGPTTSLYYSASLLLSVLIFAPPAAVGAILSLAVGDPVAAIVGRRFGKIRLGGKSIEGAVANAVVTFFLIRIFVPSSLIAAVGAVAGAAIEVVPLPLVDDNITVPLAAGGAMTLAVRFLAA